MSLSENAVTAFKKQSFRDANYRELLKSIIDDNPTASPAVLKRLFREKILAPNSEEFLESAIEYLFDLGHQAMTRPRAPEVAAARKEQRSQHVETLKKTIKEEAIKLVLLDHTMSNGKKLGDCDMAEVAKEGGWFNRIVAKMKPGQIVRDVLSEEQLLRMRGGR